ncbi:uncharacterized protein SPSK_04692 [Sporothrix schenckii 1099-18]|uniref:Uncharacterized protein n=1 Tax=Sporothrix schenckii 1099-18 TaxID=1397361 RepID=A0A0F2M5I7_SPOSC|nr:uncharacterized protein SPSK_04692 [Sporothrix schenckii 1099-18]KJR83436.1 hypothetical protein SPSK_04692 [Sporothrix schenckii 1099-18]
MLLVCLQSPSELPLGADATFTVFTLPKPREWTALHRIPVRHTLSSPKRRLVIKLDWAVGAANRLCGWATRYLDIGPAGTLKRDEFATKDVLEPARGRSTDTLLVHFGVWW